MKGAETPTAACHRKHLSHNRDTCIFSFPQSPARCHRTSYWRLKNLFRLLPVLIAMAYGSLNLKREQLVSNRQHRVAAIRIQSRGISAESCKLVSRGHHALAARPTPVYTFEIQRIPAVSSIHSDLAACKTCTIRPPPVNRHAFTH